MSRPVEITLLTQRRCAWCEDVQQVLARLAKDFPLRVSEVDLASDEGQRLALRARVLFAPGVLVDGKPFSHGRLSERKLRRALAERSRAAELHGGDRP